MNAKIRTMKVYGIGRFEVRKELLVNENGNSYGKAYKIKFTRSDATYSQFLKAQDYLIDNVIGRDYYNNPYMETIDIVWEGEAS